MSDNDWLSRQLEPMRHLGFAVVASITGRHVDLGIIPPVKLILHYFQLALTNFEH